MWKFHPIYKSTIWGGNKIASMRGFFSDKKIGECWLLSSLPGEESEVIGGPDAGLSINDLLRRDAPGILGQMNAGKYGGRFPLLFKIIDAADRLSVQVHPDNELAQAIGKPHGKTEMWYMMECDPGAELTLGFNREIAPEELNELISSGKIESSLNRIEAGEGDVFFIPAGTIHSIGRGCFLVEIQQASDVTYRIYDYNRRNDQGEPRELHVDMATRALDLSVSEGHAVSYQPLRDIPVNVVRSPFFTVNVLHLDEQMVRDYSECDSFVAIVATHGKAILSCNEEEMEICTGELVLIPASTDHVSLEPHDGFACLEIYIK